MSNRMLHPPPPLSGPLSSIHTSLYCINCGKNNHNFLSCTEPNNSYGILCFYKGEGQQASSSTETKILMIRRKHTIPYIDFLRGKYDVNNFKYMLELFTKMTSHEITHIVSVCNFNQLRHELCLNNTSKQYKSEYETSELKFNYILMLGILHKLIHCVNKIFGTVFNVKYELNFAIDCADVLAEYADIITTLQRELMQYKTVTPTGTASSPPNSELIPYTDPEWGLPKGKREERESDLQTAIREFSEETGLPIYNLRIYKNVIPLEEQYIGMNNISYKHTYFIAELINMRPAMVEKLTTGYLISASDSYEQKSEVSKIMLLNQSDALACIRPFHISKKSVVHKAFYIMNQYKTFFY